MHEVITYKVNKFDEEEIIVLDSEIYGLNSN